MSEAYLILENGTVFSGKSFGARSETTGEVVFTTGMAGYLETLTDPNFRGQIVVQTFPLIGNYGVIPEDFDSRDTHPAGYIVREWCREPSNFRCRGRIDDFLKERGVTGLEGIDTRALTRLVRDHGTMNGCITDCPDVTDELLAKLAAYRLKDPVLAVKVKGVSEDGDENGRRVVMIDFGAKRYIKEKLLARGCRVITVPGGTSAEEILAMKPAGVMLTNGPGDPADNADAISAAAALMEAGIPIFGIDLGHQIMALAAGGRTEKLKYGHRGGNQPVRDKKTGKIYGTSQNHGYSVIADSLKEDCEVRFENVNDGTVEGIDYTAFPAFSLQFDPEEHAGRRDEQYAFDRFITMIDEKGEN